MSPRQKSASELYDLAVAAFDHAHAVSRVEMAATDARIAKLKHAAELEKIGRPKEAARLIAQVEREQRRLGIRTED